MVSTREALSRIQDNVDESMGVREQEIKPQLSPVAAAKDIGRVPLRKFGRVDIDRIIPDPKQPRREFHKTEIEHLAESIRTKGQLHPIRVRWSQDGSKWVIITGERRYRAAKHAGLTAIDCFFHEKEISESEIREEQLVENLLRQDLNPIEEAQAYNSLMKLNDWNGKQVAEALNVSRSRVSRSLAMLQLPTEVQRQVEAGEVPRSSAYELSKIDNANVQQTLAEQVASGATTHEQTKRAVQKRRGKPKAQPRGTKQVFIAEDGIKVSVTSPKKVAYYEIKAALEHALEEVTLRIDNNVQLF